ncbi:ribonuclease P protein component [Elizabethkingia sp. JS20170427COW]|uniref:ribonuclease P protein component n=1 Tax=Elizabethkingia sp. JS20170427COW TaxID=2583851 RepID=UPI001110F2EA|nr:ribonuclease P protein component [Elizabethkingia sp. JS20170427COW]QCX53191.1 ribonuclease P protein component [Elizabethkingia sp. JS20170427COW]
MKLQGYPREEKLKAKKEIEALFKEGKWISCGKIRIIYLANTPSTKVGVSVSKRYFKKAVFRNRVKRLLREAYRIDKGALHQKLGEHFHCMIFWTSPTLPEKLENVQKHYYRLCQTEAQ